MTVWVLVDEMTRNAHAAHSPDQGLRYMHWVRRAEATGRATVHGPVCLVGNNWAVECDTSAEAEWLIGWLIESCGFRPTMLRTTRRDPTRP